MKTIAAGQPVIFIDAEGKERQGVITESLPPNAARIDITKRNAKGDGPADPEKAPLGTHTAEATYSESKEKGTFHFPADSAEPKAAPAASKNGVEK